MDWPLLPRHAYQIAFYLNLPADIAAVSIAETSGAYVLVFIAVLICLLIVALAAAIEALWQQLNPRNGPTH